MRRQVGVGGQSPGGTDVTNMALGAICSSWGSKFWGCSPKNLTNESLAAKIRRNSTVSIDISWFRFPHMDHVNQPRTIVVWGTSKRLSSHHGLDVACATAISQISGSSFSKLRIPTHPLWSSCFSKKCQPLVQSQPFKESSSYWYPRHNTGLFFFSSRTPRCASCIGHFWDLPISIFELF